MLRRKCGFFYGDWDWQTSDPLSIPPVSLVPTQPTESSIVSYLLGSYRPGVEATPVDVVATQLAGDVLQYYPTLTVSKVSHLQTRSNRILHADWRLTLLFSPFHLSLQAQLAGVSILFIRALWYRKWQESYRKEINIESRFWVERQKVEACREEGKDKEDLEIREQRSLLLFKNYSFVFTNPQFQEQSLKNAMERGGGTPDLQPLGELTSIYLVSHTSVSSLSHRTSRMPSLLPLMPPDKVERAHTKTAPLPTRPSLTELPSLLSFWEPSSFSKLKDDEQHFFKINPSSLKIRLAQFLNESAHTFCSFKTEDLLFFFRFLQ